MVNELSNKNSCVSQTSSHQQILLFKNRAISWDHSDRIRSLDPPIEGFESVGVRVLKIVTFEGVRILRVNFFSFRSS